MLSPYWKIKYLLYSTQDVRSTLCAELITAKILTLRSGTEVRPEGRSVAGVGAGAVGAPGELIHKSLPGSTLHDLSCCMEPSP